MLSEWQQIQQKIWALEAEVRHLQTSTGQVLSRLEKLHSYRCELRLAIRQLRHSSNTSQVVYSKNCSLSQPLGLEKLASAETAEAWTTLLRQLAQSPKSISLLARAAGPQSHELLALFAAVLAEEPPVASLQGLSESTGTAVLEKIISVEIEAFLQSQALAVELEASSLLSSDSFLGELCHVLTAQEPACMAWGHGVLHREARVREAVRQLMHVSPSTAEGGDDEHQESRPTSSIGTDTSRKLQNAVSAIVTSFCDHASVAPLGLCRLTAIVRRQLASHCVGHSGSEHFQDAVLGELIFRRWLLPSLSPGLHARHDAHAAFGVLAKSLIQIASGGQGASSRKSSEDDPSGSLGSSGSCEKCSHPLDFEFFGQEVLRLRSGLFDVLAARGEFSALQAEVKIPSRIAWPRCFVCTAGDLAALVHALNGDEEQPSPEVIAAGISSGVNEEVLRALRSVPTGHYGTAVICWVSEHAAAEQARDKGAMQRIFANTFVTALSATGSSSSNQATMEDCVYFSSLAVGAPAISQDAMQAQEEQKQRNWMALLWRCLADSQALDGPADGTLTAALQALTRSYGPAPSGGLSGQRLRLEALLSWLRPHDDPRLALLLTPKSSGPTAEERLLGCFCSTLELRQSRLAEERNLLIQLQVAEPLLEQLCMDTLRMLKDCARHKTQLLCSSRLQALWQAGAKRRSMGKSSTMPAAVQDAPRDRSMSDDLSEVLELCILSMAADAPGGRELPTSDSSPSPSLQGRPRSKSVSSKWLSNIFGQDKETSHRASDPLKGLGLMPSSIQIFEVPQCPIHRVLLAGASMGLEAQSLEHNLKHETVRGLHQAVRALQQLPLDSELLSPEPLGVGTAVQTILEQIVWRLLAHCQRFDPPLPRPEAAPGSPPDCCAPEEPGDRCLVKNWPRPAEVVRTDEQHVRDNAVQFLFSHLHAHIFPPKPTEADLRLSRQIAQLSWLEPRHLDISPVFAEMPQAERAVMLLRGLRGLRSPKEMLDALAMAFRGLTESACVFAQAGIAEGNDEALGADVSLPLFVLVIIRANPPMLESVLTYVERFTPKAQLLTEEGYAQVQARAAVSFAENLTAADLVGLRPGEWEDSIGTGTALHRYSPI